MLYAPGHILASVMVGTAKRVFVSVQSLDLSIV